MNVHPVPVPMGEPAMTTLVATHVPVLPASLDKHVKRTLMTVHPILARMEVHAWMV